jgi:hypothetical protein
MSTINQISDRQIVKCVSEAISDATRWGTNCHDIIEGRLRRIGVRTNDMAESTDGCDLVCLADGRWIVWAPWEGANSVVICD